MSRFCSTVLAIVFSVGSLLAQTPPKVKVLILTGVNNHKWAATTPVLREILEQTGRFEVRANEEVRGNGTGDFCTLRRAAAQLQRLKQTAGPWWDDRARQAMLDFVRNGKGLVSYHASNNAFWGGMNSISWWAAPGARPPATGPITPIRSKSWTRKTPSPKACPQPSQRTDELYHGLSMQPGIHVLATAYDDPNNCWKPNAGLRHGKRRAADLDGQIRHGPRLPNRPGP